jgi:hypothetical protein
MFANIIGGGFANKIIGGGQFEGTPSGVFFV